MCKIDTQNPQSDPSHVHHTWHSLAIELEDATQDPDTFSTCSTCRQAYKDLLHVLHELDHPSPRVALEAHTRHRSYHDLFTLHLTHAERLLCVRSDTLYHQWGLCQLLIRESALDTTGSAWSLQLAELATEIAERLDPDFYLPDRVADLRSLASIRLANAQHLMARAPLHHGSPETTDLLMCHFLKASKILMNPRS